MAIDQLDLLEKQRDTSQDLATASVEVLSANPARTAAFFTNDSGVAIYLALGAAAVANKGIRLNSNGGAFEINKSNLWRGAVNAIAASGTGNTLCITEIETGYADL